MDKFNDLQNELKKISIDFNSKEFQELQKILDKFTLHYDFED